MEQSKLSFSHLSIFILLKFLSYMFFIFIHNYADRIDITHLFFGFCKKSSIIFRIDQKFDNIPRKNTKIEFFKKILINCYLLVER